MIQEKAAFKKGNLFGEIHYNNQSCHFWGAAKQ